MAQAVNFDVQDVIGQLQQRCKALFGELYEFQDYLKQQEKENLIELRAFQMGLELEMKFIDRLVTADVGSPKAAHALNSSNLSYYEAVWSATKRCKDVTALMKRFYSHPWIGKPYTYGAVAGSRPMPPWKEKSHNRRADIVAQNGLEWVIVSLATEKRIIWDLAKAGWVVSSDDNDGRGEDTEVYDGDEPKGLLKQVAAVLKASRIVKIHYRHPKVRVDLPRISRNCAKEVSEVLQRIQNLGVTVLTSDDFLKSSPPLFEVFERMTIDPFANFSSVLNIDCTVLLAFISDVSHGRVEPQHWHSQNIATQIVLEQEMKLLPKLLFPACGPRELVCTRDAAAAMLKIVETIGSETEKRRAVLLVQNTLDLTDGQLRRNCPTLAQCVKENASLSTHRRFEEFQKISDHPIPPEWKIPIRVVPVAFSALKRKLPPSAEAVSQSLTEINKSVFLYGWATGLTTLSHSWVVAKSIEKIIEANRQSVDEAGPHIWLSPTSRSLVGKEKTTVALKKGHENLDQ